MSHLNHLRLRSFYKTYIGIGGAFACFNRFFWATRLLTYICRVCFTSDFLSIELDSSDDESRNCYRLLFKLFIKITGLGNVFKYPNAFISNLFDCLNCSFVISFKPSSPFITDLAKLSRSSDSNQLMSEFCLTTLGLVFLFVPVVMSYKVVTAPYFLSRQQFELKKYVWPIVSSVSDNFFFLGIFIATKIASCHGL